jgi:hypothetical protein
LESAFSLNAVKKSGKLQAFQVYLQNIRFLLREKGGTGTFVSVICIVANPGSGAFLTPGFWFLDPTSWIRNKHPGSYFQEFSNV